MNYTIKKSVRFTWRGVDCIVDFRYRDYRKEEWLPSQKSWSEMNRDRNKKARLYYSNHGVMEQAYGEHPPYSRIGDDPENDKAWRKYNRAETELARAAIEAAFPTFGKSSFSRYAGCSCPCSPGFISQSLIGGEGWIDVRPANEAAAVA